MTSDEMLAYLREAVRSGRIDSSVYKRVRDYVSGTLCRGGDWLMAEYIVDTTDGIYNARTTGELTRCRDCEHYRRGRCDWLLMDTGGRTPKPVPLRPALDGYCAWAERRRDGSRD